MENLSDDDLMEVREEYSLVGDSAEATASRCSSKRSIKRKRFDDELVEYSLAMPGPSHIKGAVPRRTQYYSTSFEPLSTPSSTSIPASIALAGPSTSTQPPPQIGMRPKSIQQRSTSSRSKNKRPKCHLTLTNNDVRWKPVDDLSLIIGIEQVNDIHEIYIGTKFSCKFTEEEILSRWCALLHDAAVSKVAKQAMRNLHPEMVAAVQRKALWSEQEDNILETIEWNSFPTIETFADLLSQHPMEFYTARTPNSLFHHWHCLRRYYLLPGQVCPTMGMKTIPVSLLTLEEAEKLEMQQMRNLKEIRQLKNESLRLDLMVENITAKSEFGPNTLAILRGKRLEYLMTSRQVTIGRPGKAFKVDIDLALEGDASKISRRQATLKLETTGEFYLYSEGKRPILVGGTPLLTGEKMQIYHNTVLDFDTMSLVFRVNQHLISEIYADCLI